MQNPVDSSSNNQINQPSVSEIVDVAHDDQEHNGTMSFPGQDDRSAAYLATPTHLNIQVDSQLQGSTLVLQELQEPQN